MSNASTYQTRELLALVAEGDERAFANLLKIILPFLEAVVIRIVHSEEHAKEILQESFIRIWLNRDKLPALEKPEAWFKRVTLNETFTWLNKNAARAKIFTHFPGETAAIPADAPENISLRETLSVLQIAIEQMPPQRKLIYQMSRMQGLKSKEIAQRLNLSNGYVKNTLSSALESLRQRLADAGKFILWIIFLKIM